MSAKIDFTDATGAATLECKWPVASARRLQNWQPYRRPVGEHDHELGTGRRHIWPHRTDKIASFEIAGIPNTDVDIAQRLIDHLLNGGTCALDTGDGTHTYSECGLAPNTEPELTLEDRTALEYRFRVTLINLGSSASMLCEY